jgi:hypothetical protein
MGRGPKRVVGSAGGGWTREKEKKTALWKETRKSEERGCGGYRS